MLNVVGSVKVIYADTPARGCVYKSCVCSLVVCCLHSCLAPTTQATLFSILNKVKTMGQVKGNTFNHELHLVCHHLV